MVKELRKKHMQGRLPPGVTLAALIKKSGGGSGAAATAKVEEGPVIETVEDAWRELGKMVGGQPQSESPPSVNDSTERGNVTGAAVVPSEKQAGPRIEDYVEPDVEDVFEELAGKFRQQGVEKTQGGDSKYTQVGS